MQPRHPLPMKPPGSVAEKLLSYGLHDYQPAPVSLRRLTVAGLFVSLPTAGSGALNAAIGVQVPGDEPSTGCNSVVEVPAWNREVGGSNPSSLTNSSVFDASFQGQLSNSAKPAGPRGKTWCPPSISAEPRHTDRVRAPKGEHSNVRPRALLLSRGCHQTRTPQRRMYSKRAEPSSSRALEDSRPRQVKAANAPRPVRCGDLFPACSSVG